MKGLHLFYWLSLFVLLQPRQILPSSCERTLRKIISATSVQVEEGYRAKVRVAGDRTSMAVTTETALDVVAQPILLRRLSEVLRKINEDHRTIPIFQKTADAMGLSVVTDGLKMNEIPTSGPLLIIANHPLSGVDGIALASEISKVRSDTKVVLNQMLQTVPGVGDVSIGVDVTNPASRDNIKAFRDMNSWVKDGHALIIFPAGNVSRRQTDGTISDTEWSKSIVRITQKSNAKVLPVFVHGQPGKIFNAIDRINPKAAGSWVPMEIIRQRNSTVHLTLGTPLDPEVLKNFDDESPAVQFLREKTYQLAEEKR